MERRNPAVIVVNGFARGGTNVVWNLFQTHPRVCSARWETGRILSLAGIPYSGSVLRRILTAPWVLHAPFFPGLAWILDRRLFRLKMQNLMDPYNRYKNEQEVYTREELAATVVCLKSVNRDMDYSDLLERMYEDIWFVELFRNGYALCESWLRRGARARDVGRFYREYGEKMLARAEQSRRHRVVRFEDVLADPFGMAERLYRFAGLDPVRLPKLRIKAKPILQPDGSHQTLNAEAGQKIWLGPEEISRFLDPHVTRRQIERLTPADRQAFEAEARPILEALGYLA